VRYKKFVDISAKKYAVMCAAAKLAQFLRGGQIVKYILKTNILNLIIK